MGQTVAQREYVVNTGSNTVKYMHGDHLGSVSLMTSSTGASSGTQEFDPWGKVRGAVNTQTAMNYTGQKLDGTGLLYYHARMYDPGVGRFVSPDSIVPGASSGVGGAGDIVGQEQNSRLAVDFHESGFLLSVSGENGLILQKGYWFQLKDTDTKKAKEPWGPSNPQAFGRYNYALDNPIRYVDPTGHRVDDFGDVIEDFKEHPEDWDLTAEQSEPSTRRSDDARPGDLSVEREYTNKTTGEKIYVHDITDAKGKPARSYKGQHPTYRPYGKQIGKPGTIYYSKRADSKYNGAPDWLKAAAAAAATTGGAAAVARFMTGGGLVFCFSR